MFIMSKSFTSLLFSSFLALVIGFGVSAAHAQKTKNDQMGYTNFLGMTFVDIPTGEFIMGSCKKPPEKVKKDKAPLLNVAVCLEGSLPDPESRADERPQQKITIDRPFQMATHEVTIEQYEEFVHHYPLIRDESLLRQNALFNQTETYPIIGVSLDDIRIFLIWINMQKPEEDKGHYRLPSEAEWEYAARAGTKTIYWWGDVATCEYANFNYSRCNDLGPGEVGQYPPNPFGLYDMNGNVAEWVEDCWSNSYHRKPAVQENYFKNPCNLRVFRGGSWQSDVTGIRSAHRSTNSGMYRYTYTGFRLVRDLGFSEN